MPSISIKNLKWRYPTVTSRKEDYVLKGISLDIDKGEFIGITGPNGSGKSTLLFILKGKIPKEVKLPAGKEMEYFEGSIEVDGEKLIEINGSSLMINNGIYEEVDILNHQEPNLERTRTVESLLSDYSENFSLEDFKKFIDMSGFGYFKDVLNENVFNVPLWKVKSLIILDMIRRGKRIILLDDPTSGLDPVGRINISDFIKNLHKENGITLIISSLDVEFLKSTVDRIIFIENGSIKFDRRSHEMNTNQDITSHPEMQKILSMEPEVLDNLKEIKGFKIERKESRPGELLVSIRDLTFSYDGKNNALENLDLDIYRGEFLALVGHNGSGKTTLSRILVGELEGWKGTIEVKGGLKYKSRIKKNPSLIGYSSQLGINQNDVRTVVDLLKEKVRELGLPPEEEKNLIERTLENVSLLGKENDKINMLSRGESRRLALALVLVENPEIIIVDEPTLGQDFERAREIMELLADLNKAGVTIIVITHDMSIVAEYTRRVIVLNDGKKIFDGPPENLFENDELMKDSSLVPPNTVIISKKLRETGIIDSLLLSAKEWIEFFNFEKQRRSYQALKFHDLKEYARKMAKEILRKYGRPDAIIYIERGGMVIGRLLSDFLAVKQVYSIKASYYADTGEPMPSVNIGKFEYELRGSEGYILLVDDIADTGKTIEAVLAELRDKVKKKILVATVVYKPQSVVKPDVFGFTVPNNTWIVFDYEETETLNSFIRKDNREGILFMKNNFGVP